MNRHRRAIIVHTLDHARAALAAAAELGVPVALRSAPGAAAYLGAPLFREIMAGASAEFPKVDAVFILDCGEDPGFALAAFRDGIKQVRINVAPEVRARLADIACQQGATLDVDPSPALDLIDCSNPVEMCRKWLSEGDNHSGRALRVELPREGGSCISVEGHSRKTGEIKAMRVTQRVKKILDNYESGNPGTKANLARILSTGRLAGTGKMVILPVDQGFEHGPVRSFGPNPPAYDPAYHIQLAIDAGLNAYATALGMIEAVADEYAGQIPLILKVNSSNTLYRSKEAPSQAITASVDDAVRLGCSAIGFTIYPGSDAAFDMMEDIREMATEAKAKGLAVVIWSYPRGGNLSKDGELAVDISVYATHIAALLGAHIIKVKLPTDFIEQPEAKKVYEKEGIDVSTQAARVRHVMQAAFNGRRLVVFSGGAMKGADAVYQDARDIVAGGGNGQIIGRNTFQRPREEALEMLNRIINIFLGKEEAAGVAKAAE